MCCKLNLDLIFTKIKSAWVLIVIYNHTFKNNMKTVDSRLLTNRETVKQRNGSNYNTSSQKTYEGLGLKKSNWRSRGLKNSCVKYQRLVIPRLILQKPSLQNKTPYFLLFLPSFVFQFLLVYLLRTPSGGDPTSTSGRSNQLCWASLPLNPLATGLMGHSSTTVE